MDGAQYPCGKNFAGLLRKCWPECKNGRLPAELAAALCPESETMLAGHAVAVSASVLENILSLNIRKISPLHRLTPRELEVAQLYGQGKTCKEIGLLLDISPVTVRNFCGRIYTKLDIGNKVELASLLTTE
jgi:DNA-binding CsgD family transcriptional regulator